MPTKNNTGRDLFRPQSLDGDIRQITRDTNRAGTGKIGLNIPDDVLMSPGMVQPVGGGSGEIGPVMPDQMAGQQSVPNTTGQNRESLLNSRIDPRGGNLPISINKLEESYSVAANSAARLANEEANLLQQQAMAAEQRGRQREEEILERQQIRDQKKQALDASQAEIMAADAEAGTGYWENRSTGAKIAAAIATALGAYSSAITGGPNTAMNIIESAIQQDSQLKIRKAQVARDRGTRTAQRYDSLLDELKDESAVRDVMLADGYAATKLKVDSLASRAKSSEARAKALEASGMLGMKIDELLGQAAAKSAEAEAEKMRLQIDDEGTLAVSQDEAKKIREMRGQVDAAEAAINDLIDSVQSVGSGRLSPTQKQVVENKVFSAIPLVQSALGMQGQMSERNAKLLEKLVADPSRIINFSDDIKSLQSIRGTLRNTLEQRAQAVAQPGQVVNLPSRQSVAVTKIDERTGRAQTVTIPRDRVGRAEDMGWRVVPQRGFDRR